MTDDEKTTPVPTTDEIATASKDLDIFSGWLTRLENPDPVLRTEASGKGLKLYDEVARDPHAGAVLQTRYLSVAGREWEVVPADDSQRSADIAAVVSRAINGANFTRTVSEMMQAVLYGFSVAEVMWTAVDGLWLPKAVVGKHARRFSFTMDRALRLLTPQNMIDGEAVPDRKFVVFTWGSSDNPYGSGLGQKLWWPVWFKKNGIKFWLIFLEKFGMPTAVGKYPPGTAKDQQQALLDAIDAIQNETGVKIPNNMEIDLLEAARSGKVTYETLCEYMDKQISKAVLGQTATTEGTPGKLGNETAQQDVRADILKADADLFSECVNQSLVRWIVDYNFSGVTQYPTLWIRTDDEQDLSTRIKVDRVLANEIRLPIGRRYFYETYAVPEPADNEEIVTPRQSAPEPAAGQFAEPQRFTEEQQAIEDMIDGILAEAGEASEEISAAIKNAVEKAESYEELHILMAEALGDTASSAKLDDLLARAMLAGDMWGRYAAS